MTRTDLWWACERKKKFGTEALALRVAASAVEPRSKQRLHRHRPPPRQLAVYRCPHCRCWHLTSKAQVAPA